MLIRLGYEIAIECTEATPVISLLEIHKGRQADIKRQTRVLTSPSVSTSVYQDLHGNTCRRFLFGVERDRACHGNGHGQ